MDYKDLANVIYPDAKSIEYYEEMYKPRNLAQGAEVTRLHQVQQDLFTLEVFTNVLLIEL